MGSEDSCSEKINLKDGGEVPELMRPEPEDAEVKRVLGQPHTPFGSDQLNKAMEQYKAPFDGEQLSKVMERLHTDQISKVMERLHTPYGSDQISKVMERLHTPFGSDQISKVMERLHTPFVSDQVSKVMERLHTPFENDQLKKVMEQYKAPFGGEQLSKVMEQLHAPFGGDQLKKLMEQLHTPFGSSQLREVMEHYQAPIESGHLRALLKRLNLEAGSSRAGVSVKSLLDELKGRADLSDDISVETEHLSRIVYAEGIASASATLTGQAQVVRGKTKVLSVIPTWFLWQLLCVLITVLINGDAVRQTIVRINASIPSTESFHEIRKYIRTELAGKPGDFRLVTGSSVNLRDGPSMKSGIIIQLPKNAAVAVLGKVDRTWLLVSYEHEGYLIEGYVSTKFLKKVR